ncbi:MAG TPA: hypothetical protein VEU62_16580 [Bryobacterales bacterium]|nr:hypothetical protein [Bryobacterales bacterium]
MRRNLLIGAFVALAALAVAGWVRKPAPPVDPSFEAGQTALAPPATAYGAPADAAPAAPQAPAVQQPAMQPEYAPQQQYAPQQRVVRRRRPTSHSVAIVAGSAGTGAAIGALAGGGRGAAVGALSGGAAGFIYDRLTHDSK